MEAHMQNHVKLFKRRVGMSVIILAMVLGMLSLVSVGNLLAQETEEAEFTEIPENRAQVIKFALIGAAVAFGFGAIGAGIAIGNVGSAAMGAIAEKPEIASQALIFIALAEGLVVFGFITALMILGKV
jgi:V/A-type H+-transporting ATPase subunit K